MWQSQIFTVFARVAPRVTLHFLSEAATFKRSTCSFTAAFFETLPTRGLTYCSSQGDVDVRNVSYFKQFFINFVYISSCETRIYNSFPTS